MPLLKNLPILLLAAALVVVSGSTFASLTTRAAFTDTATATATFTSGSVDLDLASATDCSTGTFSDAVPTPLINELTGIPGDLYLVDLCVKNEGTLDFRWELATAVGGNGGDGVGTILLDDNYFLRVWKQDGTATACTQRLNANGTDIALPGTENELLATTPATGALTIPVTPLTQIAAGSTMKVCIGAVLDSDFDDTDADLGTSAQNKTLTFTFSFTSRTF